MRLSLIAEEYELDVVEVLEKALVEEMTPARLVFALLLMNMFGKLDESSLTCSFKKSPQETLRVVGF